MAKTDFQSIDHYIAGQPEASRPVLEEVRAAIRAALPEAQEVISYQIPAFKQGAVVIFFAGWKKHYSVYPVMNSLVETLGEELKPYERSKGTIRFPLSEPVPTRLIGKIAALRAAEAAAELESRKARRRKAAKAD